MFLLIALFGFQTALAQPVEVNSAEPSEAPQNTIALEVTIHGRGFDNSASVQFFKTGTTNPAGITVNSSRTRGSKKIIANIDVAADADVADFDIEVSMSGGRGGKGTTLFRVLQSQGGGSGGARTPLKVTFNQLVGPDSLPSSMVHDSGGPLYIDKENVDAVSGGDGFSMDFPGLKWRGGRGRQLYFHYTCDDSTALGGDCSVLGTVGDVQPGSNPGEWVSSLNILNFRVYESDCPLGNSCPSNGMIDMEPGVSELVGMSAIVKCCRPFIQMQTGPVDIFNCSGVLSPTQLETYLEGCYETSSSPPEGAPFCNAIMTGYDLDPGVGNGNDVWSVYAENATTLLCTEDQFIGIATFSFDLDVERK
jgi:hypothetical protein